MRLFNTIAPAQPCVGARCARKRLARSRCDYCVKRCPTGALSIHHHEVILAPEHCTGCGICLFVCPADALEDLVPLARIHREGVLLGPFTQPVAAEELMLWHTQYRIRAVAVDLTRDTLWLRPLAELNLWLKKRGEPGWQCVAVSPAAGEAKRRLLRPDGERARVAYDVAPGVRRWRFYPHTPSCWIPRAACYAVPVAGHAPAARYALANRRSRSIQNAAMAAATARPFARLML